MAYYECTELNMECRMNELNRYDNAFKKFEKEKDKLEIAKLRYLEVVRNMGWRDWVYTNYDNYIKKIMWKNKIKNIDLKNYQDEKVFEYINSDNGLFREFSISKETVDYIKPKSIEELAKVLAMGSCIDNEYILKIIKIKNLILFDEEIIDVLSNVFKNKKECELIYQPTRKIRYDITSQDTFNIFKALIEDKGFSIYEFIKSKYIFEYMNYLKVAYFSFMNSAFENNIKNPEEMFDNILLGVIISCNKKEAVKCAKNLYKMAMIDMQQKAKNFRQYQY